MRWEDSGRGLFTASGRHSAVGMEWRSALQLSIVPPLIMGIVFYKFRNAIPVSTTVGSVRLISCPFLYSWTTRKGFALITAITTYNMALIALMTISPLFVQRELGYSTSEAGLFFALAMLIGAAGKPLVGRWSDRIGLYRVLIWGLNDCGFRVLFWLRDSRIKAGRLGHSSQPWQPWCLFAPVFSLWLLTTQDNVKPPRWGLFLL
ncbi:MAG: hypothetical protein CM1200mP18_19950 [Gammaproteobacteria bacterium]|nr:MAG: hypothetical protein CM1200mP18_19950 [Gammaproteobacteria bacterium]